MKISLKIAAKELGVSKGKIKDMIRGNHIGYELINGQYYVDIDEVKSKLNAQPISAQFLPLDDVMKFILEETLEDFKYSFANPNHKNIRLMKKVLKNGCISNFNELEYLSGYYSDVLLDGYKYFPNEFVKWFDIKTPSEFYLLRNHYFHINRNMSIYLEHFVMFDKLTNGKITIIDLTTIRLEMIKDFHFRKEVA